VKARILYDLPILAGSAISTNLYIKMPCFVAVFVRNDILFEKKCKKMKNLGFFFIIKVDPRFF